MRRIETSTLSNQDITPGTVGTTGLLVHTYTADADRNLFMRLFLDQIAGNGTYSYYRTIQRSGSGTAYHAINGTLAVASGVTSVWQGFNDLSVLNGDVLKLYVIGLAGDTTTPDIITEIWEDDYLRPTTAGQWNVDVAATGEVGLDFSNVKDAGSAHTLTNITVPIVTTLTNDPSGVTTLLSRLSAARAGYLDLLNSYLNSSVAAVKVDTAAIKAKTDNLPGDPADESLLEAALSAAQSAILVETALIKAKTNNIPLSPAAVGSQMDLVNAPNATAVTAIQNGLATAANLTTVLNRLGSISGSSVNTVLGFFRALASKTATLPSDLTSGGLTYTNTTDSLEAIRDRGDAAWVTGSGGAPTVTQIRTEMDTNSTQLIAIKAKTDSLTFTVAGKVDANATHLSGDATAADNAERFFDGTGYAGTNNIIPTVTTLTNAPGDSSGVTTLLSRLSSARAGYLDILAGWTGTLLETLRAMARKDAASVDLGATYDESTDSLEALREQVDTLAAVQPITQNESITES